MGVCDQYANMKDVVSQLGIKGSIEVKGFGEYFALPIIRLRAEKIILRLAGCLLISL
jgi:hypothetical protein